MICHGSIVEFNITLHGVWTHTPGTSVPSGLQRGMVVQENGQIITCRTALGLIVTVNAENVELCYIPVPRTGDILHCDGLGYYSSSTYKHMRFMVDKDLECVSPGRVESRWKLADGSIGQVYSIENWCMSLPSALPELTTIY